MKITKLALNLSLLSVIAMITTGCPKTPNAEAPVADTETETAVDAMWATFVISDIEQIVSFISVNNDMDHFYAPIPGTGVIYVNHHPGAKRRSIAFEDTRSRDGVLRDGAVEVNYEFDTKIHPDANPNSTRYDDYGYSGAITLSNYKVNGWLIDEFDNSMPGRVYNELKTNKWDPKVTNLTWRLGAKYKLTHDSFPGRSIVWDGVIYKTLTNTSDPKVYATNRDVTVDWRLTVVSYSGTISGSTHNNRPFKMEIGGGDQQLVRDFQCYPEKVADVTVAPSGTLVARANEFHPFIKGVATFTTGDKYPRRIYVGNEGNPELPAQCDNVGEVLIKGISYKVNFRRH